MRPELGGEQFYAPPDRTATPGVTTGGRHADPAERLRRAEGADSPPVPAAAASLLSPTLCLLTTNLSLLFRQGRELRIVALGDGLNRMPFVGTYRTLCLAPEEDFRKVLEGVRSLLRAA